MSGIQVYSEIGKLKRVLVHRPGMETQNYPEDDFEQVFTLRKWSKRFDLEQALTEHERLIALFRAHGIEVLELRDLLIETLEEKPAARKKLESDYLSDCGVHGSEMSHAVSRLLKQADTAESFVDTVIDGIRYGSTPLCEQERFPLSAIEGEIPSAQTMLVNPLNTLFFTRDPASIVGNDVLLNHMYWPERNREVGLYRCLFSGNRRFDSPAIHDLNRNSYHVEGGDVLNLDRGTVCIGVSERSEAAAVDILAKKLLYSGTSKIDRILAIRVPSSGLRIHLDTFINRIDYDAFLIDRDLCTNLQVYLMTRGRKKGTVQVKSLDDSLESILASVLGHPIRIVDCGGGDEQAHMREQSGNATAVLCLEPGKLCVYQQNARTNEALEKAGMELFPLSIEELTKGYGGPNCICLPLWREEL